MRDLGTGVQPQGVSPFPDMSGSRLYCYRCGCYWKTRSADLPKTCPRCGSSRWNDPVKREASCRFCGRSWTMGSIDEPCPGCGHTIFEAPDQSMHHCNRCDHEWRPRTDSRPYRCPLCKSTKWDSPRPVRRTCRVCGNVWVGGEERPKRCPSCRSTVWDRNPVRVQCKICGHRWAIKGGRMSDDVGRCPSCRSSVWMVPPAIDRCPECGLNYIARPGSPSVCPRCMDRPGFRTMVCGFCGMDWGSSGDSGTCPRCGRPAGSGDDRFMTLWSDGAQTLQYAYMDGFAFVYLWEKGRPTAAAYFHDVCSRMGMTQQGFVDALNGDSIRAKLRDLAREMKAHRFDYLEKVDYFIKRLGLSDEDAIILAIHFTGMCPEAIALQLNRPFKEVRLAFDRIMAAYGDNGIAVDDGVFTDDPFQFYRRSRPSGRHHPDVSMIMHINLITEYLDGIYIQLGGAHVRRDHPDEGNGGGGVTLQTAERPGGRSVLRSSRQCTCPYCGGCFGLDDDGRTERVTEYDCQCTRCGHAWKSRVPEPVKCPGCGVSGWRSKQESCRCLRCGHAWTPRGKGRRPARCPECKSKYWNGVPDAASKPMPPQDTTEILHRRWITKKYEEGKGCLRISLETGIALFEVIGILREELGAQQPKLRRPSTDASISEKEERV